MRDGAGHHIKVVRMELKLRDIALIVEERRHIVRKGQVAGDRETARVVERDRPAERFV